MRANIVRFSVPEIAFWLPPPDLPVVSSKEEIFMEANPADIAVFLKFALARLPPML